MKILIIGPGTIGKPLIQLFLKKARELDIRVMFHKNKAEERSIGMLKKFIEAGAELVVYRENMAEFEKLLRPYHLKPTLTLDDALAQTEVVIDCTEKEVAEDLKEKYYQRFPNIKGFIAQGSVSGFGKTYAFGINDAILAPSKDRFIQVVSCNVHQTLRLLKSLVFDPYNEDTSGNGQRWDFDNLIRGRLHLARRGADISQSYITIGPKVGKPTDSRFGTRQGADVIRVLSTFPHFPNNLDLYFRADEYNHPYMHVSTFFLTLREQIDKKEVINRLRSNNQIAVTFETEVHRVFSEGREFGHFGRILNQAVACLPSLDVIDDGHEVTGCFFTPQDGNALLSSVAAALWFNNPQTYKHLIAANFFKLPFTFDEV